MLEGIAEVLKRNRARTGKQDSGFVQLFVSKRLIQGAAAALLGIFVPIFLYETAGLQFWVVGGYYAFLSFLYVVLLAPSMKITNYVGFSHSLILGSIASVMQYTVLFFMNEENIWLLLGPLGLSLILFRLFHWVPYHVDFTLFTKAGERGRQVSLSFATIAFMGVIGPILAGFIVAHAGYPALFGVAVALLLAATVSYAFVPETPTHFDWSAADTWRKFFSKDMRGVIVGEFANGAEVAVTLIVWPIFLYEILAGDVFSIGAVSTIIVGVTIVLQLLVGKYLDGRDGTKEKTLRVGSTLYAVGWIFKIFVLSASQVFFVGLYHNIVKIFTKTPFSAILYDMSAEQGKYVDEFTVLREMANHSGRTISLTLVSVAALFIPIGWTFIIAAVASLALNMVYRYHQH